jgi:hypothetical protein
MEYSAMQGSAPIASATLRGLQDQFLELDAEMDQLRSIIASTVTTLYTSFAGIEPRAHADDDTGLLLREHFSTGISTLQFEDIASQLIEHMRRRKSVVHELVTRLSLAVEHSEDPLSLRDALSSMHTDAEVLFQSVSHKSVDQTDMDSGDIELF